MRYWIWDVKSSNKNVYFIVEINARRCVFFQFPYFLAESPHKWCKRNVAKFRYVFCIFFFFWRKTEIEIYEKYTISSKKKNFSIVFPWTKWTSLINLSTLSPFTLFHMKYNIFLTCKKRKHSSVERESAFMHTEKLFKPRWLYEKGWEKENIRVEAKWTKYGVNVKWLKNEYK